MRLPVKASAAVVATAMLVTAGCGGAGRPSSSVPSMASTRSPARPVIPLSASFVSASVGWLLAAPECARHGCRTLLLRKTTDGGRTWAAAAFPPARLSVFPSGGFGTPSGAAGTVNTVLFANAADGWLYGPGLLATRDGGSSWHKVSTHGLQVVRMGAGDGMVFAVFTSPACHAGICPSQLYSARLGSENFQPLPGTAGADGAASTIAVLGSQAYVGAFYGFQMRHGVGVPRQALLTGPASGTSRWHALKLPGPRGDCGPSGMFLATTGHALVLGCAGEPSAGMQHKWVWVSQTGGRTWQQATSPPISPGYLTDLSAAPSGTLAESGYRADVHLSWDDGHTWHTSASLGHAYQATGAAGLAVTMVTSSFGFTLVGDLYLPQIYLTRDGGHTWTAATVH